MSDDKVYAEFEAHMEELSRVDTDLRELEVAKDRKVKEAIDEYAPQIDPLSARRDELMEVLAKMYLENESILTTHHSKTAVFRSGTVSARVSPGSLVVSDEEAVMKGLRRLGLVRRFTKQAKRTINKTELKKHPDIVEKLRGVFIDRPEYLSVKLVRTQAELKKPLNPFRVRSK